jgi:peroxiredoxin Q/BCP
MTAEVGRKAPEFTLPSSEGGQVSLGEFAGKKVVVLYFYPKDMTPGCTQEACDFRDQSSRLRELGAVVLGISPDPLKSHERFIQQQSLNFPLLADEDHAVCGQYGVWVEKNMYGNKSMGVERSTFVIGRDGKIARAWRKVKVAGHVEEVIAAVEELDGPQ